MSLTLKRKSDLKQLIQELDKVETE